MLLLIYHFKNKNTNKEFYKINQERKAWYLPEKGLECWKTVGGKKVKCRNFLPAQWVSSADEGHFSGWLLNRPPAFFRYMLPLFLPIYYLSASSFYQTENEEFCQTALRKIFFPQITSQQYYPNGTTHIHSTDWRLLWGWTVSQGNTRKQ